MDRQRITTIHEIVHKLATISFVYWLTGDSTRALAFRNAVVSICEMGIPVIENPQQLTGVANIGPSITHEIKSFILFGTSERYDKLAQQLQTMSKPEKARHQLHSSIDMHVHSNLSDGLITPASLTRSATGEKMMEFIGITDHWKAITDIGKYVEVVHFSGALAGIELDIEADGTIAMPFDDIRKLDYVVLAIHHGTNSNLVDRYRKAISALKPTGKKAILAHPTGRKLSKPLCGNSSDEAAPARKPVNMTLDWKTLFRETADCGILLEINCNPVRFDLPAELIPLAKEFGNKFILNSDTHYWYAKWLIQNGLAVAAASGIEQADLIATSRQFHTWLTT